MNQLSVRGIKTRVFKMGEFLPSFIVEHILSVIGETKQLEGKVLAVTSKIVSLSENRILSKDGISKKSLVRKEADVFLGEIGHGCFLTIKHGLFIASAGIDESNADGDYYILYPEDPFRSAQELYLDLVQRFGLSNFGVLFTDSHTSPLRAGVTGVTLAYAGFRGIRNHIGSPDLFGKPLKMTRVNVADALSVAAVYCMGESDESTPLALLDGNVEFLPRHESVNPQECVISPEYDLYGPLYLKK